MVDPSAPLLAPVLITLGLSAIATGIVLCGFGVTRMGRAIRYVPYPVVGGFLGATGCLIVLGAIWVITGERLQFATLDRFANMVMLSELAAACAMALILYLTWHRSRSPFGLPVDPDRRRDRRARGVLDRRHLAGRGAGRGLDLSAPAARHLHAAVDAAKLAGIPGTPLPDLLAILIAVIFVTATSTLFNTTGIEVASHREANLERELNVTGLANILSGALAAAIPAAFRSAAPCSISAAAAPAGCPA